MEKRLLFSNQDLVRLIFPLVIEQTLAILLGMVDIMMVASLGEASVSGVSLVDSINILLLQIFAALGTGGAVVVSQFVGRNDPDKASRAARQLIYSTVAVSVIIVGVALVFHKQILRLIFGNIDADVMDAAERYFLITLCALPSIAIYSGCAGLFRAQGNSSVSMMSSALVNILNIGGNAILLYGFGWGVEGVAVPTLISRTVAAAVLLFLLYRNKEYHGKAAISIKGISHVYFDWELIKRILMIGIPNGIENGMFQIGKLMMMSLIASFGTTAIAANAACGNIASFSCLPGTAIGLSMLTVIGQCVGAGDINAVTYYTKKLMRLAYIYIAVLNVFIYIFAPQIVSIYNLAPETTSLSIFITRFYAICVIVFWSPSFALPNTLRAVNDATFTMIVSFASMWLVRVGMGYVLKMTNIFGLQDYMSWPSYYGLFGVWIAMVLDWIARSACFIIRFMHGKWKTHAHF